MKYRVECKGQCTSPDLNQNKVSAVQHAVGAALPGGWEWHVVEVIEDGVRFATFQGFVNIEPPESPVLGNRSSVDTTANIRNTVLTAASKSVPGDKLAVSCSVSSVTNSGLIGVR